MSDQGARRHRRWWRTGTMGNTFASEIPTLFAWVHPDEQRQRAEKLANLTDLESGPGEQRTDR